MLSYCTFYMMMQCFGGRYNNCEIITSKCFFWYYRKELNGVIMMSFIVLGEFISPVRYEIGINKCNLATVWSDAVLCSALLDRFKVSLISDSNDILRQKLFANACYFPQKAYRNDKKKNTDLICYRTNN